MQHLYFHKNHTTKEQFFAAYEQLSQHQTHHILLESGRGGRYSVAGLQPDVILQSIPEGLRIQDSTGAEVIHGDPLIQLEKWMTPHRTERREDLPDFQGGVIGFLSYDYARKIEKLPSLGRDDLEIPDLYFYYLKEWAVFDHQENCLWTMILSEQDPESAEAKLSQWTASWNNALSSINETKTRS